MTTAHLYVISDLHLGGAPPHEHHSGFQMCPPHARRRLARFIHHVRMAHEAGTEATPELVINGDFVDFLAEEDFKAFTGSSAEAINKLHRVFRTTDEQAPEGEQVFPALQALVQAGGRLTLLLGNHDVELSLPRVRGELLAYLTQSRPAQVEFLYDGEALERGPVLIEHGNRYDGWNAVHHGRLRAYRARLSRGEAARALAPPPGSQLVTEIMNPLKQRYRFIDLLKPENEAVIPILVALEPAVVREIRKLLPLQMKSHTVQPEPGRVPERQGYIKAGVLGQVPEDQARISAGSGVDAKQFPGSLLDFSATALETAFNEEALQPSEYTVEEGEALLETLEQGQTPGRVPPEQAQIGAEAGAWLQSAFSLWRMRKARPGPRLQHLHDAWVAQRQAIATRFDLSTEDPIYFAAAKRLAGSQPRVIVFGHTHLPKCIPLPHSGVYLNTGTWCPTIRLPEAFYMPGNDSFETLSHLARFVADLANNRTAEWTELKTLFAHVTLSAGGIPQAALCEFQDDGRIKRLGGGA